MKITLSKNQWKQIGKLAGWVKQAQFDQEPATPDIEPPQSQSPLKRSRGKFSLYDQEDLDRIEGLHLSLGEQVLPHILIDKADEVEIWETIPDGHPSAKQFTLSFMLNGNVIRDVTVNKV